MTTSGTASGTVSGSTYEAAGVSIEAGDRAVELMKTWVDKASRPEVIGGIGGFAGLFDASALKSYERPLLASSADGVGTKVAIAQALDKHDTIGFDGETAEHPGLLEPDEYDVAGSTTGVVEASQLLGPGRVRPGDVVVAMASSGLHSNGYSLVRHVLLAEGGMSLDQHVDDLGRTLGEELLEPTKIYAKACLELARETGTHAMSHVTGGGLAANLERVMPLELGATLDRSTWSLPPVFGLVQRTGSVAREDLEKTLNCGVGMVALVEADDADRAVQVLAGAGVTAWVAGTVTSAGPDRGGRVTLVGEHS
jgi:phosphoribosylformylglycinamidine cyclo-ligase